MSFGGVFENKQGGEGAKIVADIAYNQDKMPSGAISQPRLATPTLAKSMLNSSGLSLALVRRLSRMFRYTFKNHG